MLRPLDEEITSDGSSEEVVYSSFNYNKSDSIICRNIFTLKRAIILLNRTKLTASPLSAGHKPLAARYCRLKQPRLIVS